MKNFFYDFFGTRCCLKFFITNYNLFKGNTIDKGYFNFLSLSNARIHCHFTHSFSMHDSPAILSSHPSTSSTFMSNVCTIIPMHMELSFPSSPSVATENHVLIFSEINKTIICPNISFFQWHLLFRPSIFLCFSHYYSKCEFHKYLKWLPLSRLCWHVRCDPNLGVYNLVTRKGEKPTLSDSLLCVSVPAQRLMYFCLVESLYTLEMSNTLLFRWGNWVKERLSKLLKDMQWQTTLKVWSI